MSFYQEVRRGAEYAKIHSLAFSPTCNWLAVSSDKATIHIFAVPDGSKGSDGSPQAITARERSESNEVAMQNVSPQNQKSAWPGRYYCLVDAGLS